MPNRDKADVLQGTLDLMVLQTLSTLGPLHGYAVAERLEKGENEELGTAFAEITIEHYTLQKYTSVKYQNANRLNCT